MAEETGWEGLGWVLIIMGLGYGFLIILRMIVAGWTLTWLVRLLSELRSTMREGATSEGETRIERALLRVMIGVGLFFLYFLVCYMCLEDLGEAFRETIFTSERPELFFVSLVIITVALLPIALVGLAFYSLVCGIRSLWRRPRVSGD